MGAALFNSVYLTIPVRTSDTTTYSRVQMASDPRMPTGRSRWGLRGLLGGRGDHVEADEGEEHDRPGGQVDPASTNDSETAGPALVAAAMPVSTKIPVPMMTPMPKTVRSPPLRRSTQPRRGKRADRVGAERSRPRLPRISGYLLPAISRSATMADTRKPKSKPAPAGKRQPDRSGRGSGARSGTAARPRQPDKGKLAKGAAARRLEEKRRRQRTLLWTGVAVASLLALVALIWWQGRDQQAAENRPVAAAALEAGRQAAGSEGVRTFPEAGRDHIAAGEQPDNWNSNPPTSGDHLANWVQPGVYDSEQDMRGLVHSLEHGYVLLLHRGIPEDQLDQLREFVDARDGSKLILAPYSGLEQNGVALAAWRNLELLQQVNMDVVQAFVNDYMVPGATRSVAPEPNAA
jgi:Protein of unknown function (DUF3105)